MPRKVFFSFHYKRDILKIGQIRNSWLTKGETQKFLDAADWESIQRKGDAAVKKWIDEQMQGTSVTVVLIGAETASRPYVKYEIEQSHNLGKGMLGVDLYGMKDLNGNFDTKGINPFGHYEFKSSGSIITYPVYSWVNDNGRENLASWVEAAAKRAGR